MEIILENVTKTIRQTTVINNISVTWKGGMVYGLKGHNGSGKTMIMRLISGLISPSSGRILINGSELGRDFSFPPSLGLLLESPGFLGSYTGFQNLYLISQLKNKVFKDQIRDTLVRVGLDIQANKKYRKYSLGMKQRLGLAAAIMEKPDIILLDEPTNALDSNGIHMVKQIINEERARGALIVLSCHNSRDLHELSDEIYTIENGQFLDVQPRRKEC